jgi:hypothetical protein
MVALGFCLAATSFAAPPESKPKREVMPIGGQWNLSGTTLERAKMDGERVVQLIAKGQPQLKQGRNSLLGPWILEATAEVIEADFPGKKFILRGPYSIVRKVNGAKTEIVGSEAESSAELDFRDGAVRSTGPNRVKLGDPGELEKKRK